MTMDQVEEMEWPTQRGFAPHDDDQRSLQVIIETPKGSRNKYAFDPVQRTFHLKKCFRAWDGLPVLSQE